MEADFLNNVITVDPGKTTAWAYWSGDLQPKVGSLREGKYDKNKPLEEQMEKMWSKFAMIIRKNNPSVCYMEGVEVWTTSMRSQIASKTSALFKLTFLLGGYCRICQQEGIKFGIVYPSRWKGQMNDDAVKARVKRANGNEYKNPHITDAVGIGLSLMGVL